MSVCPTCGTPDGNNVMNGFHFCFSCFNTIPKFVKPKPSPWGEKYQTYKLPRDVCYHPTLVPPKRHNSFVCHCGE